jgi:hypothetical protein
LSYAAGARLTDNNPNITNLHDPNRPMKLADKFNKIYDDEWTDIIERLEKNGACIYSKVIGNIFVC